MDVAARADLDREVNRQKLIAFLIRAEAGDGGLARSAWRFGVEQHESRHRAAGHGLAGLGRFGRGPGVLHGEVVAESRAFRQGYGHVDGLPLPGWRGKDSLRKTYPAGPVIGGPRLG